MSGRPLPVEERFWSKVLMGPGGCWIWSSSTNNDGYATFWAQGAVRAHMWAYERFVGAVPPGMELDHVCHSRDGGCPGGKDCLHRRCVRPDHLEPVTHGENIARSPKRSNLGPLCGASRHAWPESALLVHTGPRAGRRYCKLCTAESKGRRRGNS